MHSLPLFVRLRGRRVILIGEGEAAAAKRRLLERAGAICVDETDEAARLAFVACDESRAGAEAAERLRARGVLVNVTDQPDLCDFTVPSIVDRDPVLIAVGTGGASAGLAKTLRLRIDALLPQGLGKLATALQTERAAMRRRWPDAAERRHALDAALAEGAALDPLAGHEPDAVTRWLATESASTDTTTRETVYLASDDPDDLTLRAARLLGRADALILHGGVPPAILARARADAVRLRAGDPLPLAARLIVELHAAG